MFHEEPGDLLCQICIEMIVTGDMLTTTDFFLKDARSTKGLDRFSLHVHIVRPASCASTSAEEAIAAYVVHIVSVPSRVNRLMAGQQNIVEGPRVWETTACTADTFPRRYNFNIITA